MEWPENPFESNNGEELVPPVDAADIKAVWQVYNDVRRTHPVEGGGLAGVAVGAAVFEGVCTRGANIRNVWYRMAMLQLLFHVVERSPDEPEAQALAKLQAGEELDDRLFRVMAQIPLKWLPKEGMQGYPFDVDTFMKQIEQEAA